MFFTLLPAADHLLSLVELSQKSWDPASGLLTLRDGNWSWDWNGRDAAGRPLKAGLYRLEVLSNQGGSVSNVNRDLLILASSIPLQGLWAGPNPAAKGATAVTILWKPANPAELRVYDSAGSLIRSWENAMPPFVWDLKGAFGDKASSGVYLVAVRLSGQNKAAVFKLAVTR